MNEKFTNIDISYYSDNEDYILDGFFLDYVSPESAYSQESTKAIKINSHREYQRSEKAFIEKYNENLENDLEKEQIKKSTPKVGMSASEVRKTK